nr:F-box associated domain, type 1 [Tanacetum cinerariifolium]
MCPPAINSNEPGVLKWLEIKGELDDTHLHHGIMSLDLNLVPDFQDSIILLVRSVNGQWRRLGYVPYWIGGSTEGTSLNGYAHWVVRDHDTPEKICSFNFDKETFQLFPSPPSDKLVGDIRYETLGIPHGFLKDFPKNIIADILSRLHVKKVIHCKSVCKNWRELVSNSYFVDLHLSRSPASVMIHHELGESSDIDFDSELEDSNEPGVLKWLEIKGKLNDTHLHHGIVTSLDLNLVPDFQDSVVLLVGSVNGLICLWQYFPILEYDNTYICNPVTKEYAILPRQNYYRIAPANKHMSEAEVYTLGTGQWRRLGHVPYWIGGSTGGTYLNGCAHWVVRDHDTPEKLFRAKGRRTLKLERKSSNKADGSTLVKEKQEKDKIGSKPDKNGKRGKARQSDQDSLNAAAGGNLLEKSPQDALTIIENKSKQTSVVTTAMTAMLKQLQANPPLAPVKAVEEICVACGGAHPYYQCLAAGGNTFSEFRDNIQGYVSAAASNYNQGNPGYRPQGINTASTSRSGSLPGNTVANPKGELKAITTRSGLVTDGPSVPTPPKSVTPEEDERVEETYTDPDLTEYTIKSHLLHELKCKALTDLGASINLMPLSVWKKLADFVVVVDYESDPRVPLILGRPFLRTARALIDVHREEIILRDGDERLTLNMKHDTTSYSNHPQKESVNLINIFNVSSEDCLEVSVSNSISGNPTVSLHKEISSTEVTHEIHDSEGCNFLSEELPNIDSFNDIHPYFDDNPLSGSTTYSSNSLLEEFTDKLALITYPPDYDDNLQFDIESDLREIEFMLYQGKDSSLKDSIDQTDLANLDDYFVDPTPEMFTDKHAPDYSSPLRFDVYDDDFLEVESDADNFYNDPFDSKGEKIKEDDDLPSPNNEDKVFNQGILIQEKSVTIITCVTQEKKLAISYASWVFKDFDPPFYEPLFFKDVPKSMMLLPFSSENKEKFSNQGYTLLRRMKNDSVKLEVKEKQEKRQNRMKTEQKREAWKSPAVSKADHSQESKKKREENTSSRDQICKSYKVVFIKEQRQGLNMQFTQSSKTSGVSAIWLKLMGDEHLDTVPATESNEFIKSSVEKLILIPSESEGIPDNMCDVPFHDNYLPLDVSKDQFEDFSDANNEFSSTDDDSFSIDNINYVEASPPYSELVSSEVMEIVIPEVGRNDDDILLTIKNNILREKLLNINLLIAKIEALNYNPTPSSDFMTKSSSSSLNSLLEETYTFDNSLPEFETFCFDVEEISSGSTTTRYDISLSEYEVFYADHVKEISNGSTTTHSDSSLYDSFIFNLSINPFPPADKSDFYEFADELTHIISPPEYDCFFFKIEPNSGDFTMDVGMKIPFLIPASAVILSHLFRPDVSHRCGTFPKFKVLNESPM